MGTNCCLGVIQLNTRYATKVFDPSKNVSEADMEKLLEAIRLSASSYGLQPYKVLVVEDPKIRAELRKVAWDQPQITDASALLVFAVKYETNEKTVDEFVDLVAQTRNIPKDVLSGYGDMMKGSLQGMNQEQVETWVSKQAYIALGFGLVAAAVLGLDACPMEGFSAPDFDNILNINKLGLKSKVIMAVGYRSPDDKYQHLAKVRQKKEDLFIKF
ncbi:MAG: NAD(P)H-dependent oxidoreductase [Bacteroidia bacterium]|nr:NAD(P)H-dependent oxidoreductase [Bacteroidia bacterium]